MESRVKELISNVNGLMAMECIWPCTWFTCQMLTHTGRDKMAAVF